MPDELQNIETLVEVCEESLMQNPGVFIFSRDGHQVAAIGRAENNVGAFLRAQLSELKKKYNFYRIQTTYSSLEAFVLHCRLYHKYQIGEHPEPNQAKPNWGCPVLGCKWEEARRARIKITISRKPALANTF